ncbi:hypothetical protein KI387_040350, partial [Taxus chinensis]
MIEEQLRKYISLEGNLSDLSRTVNEQKMLVKACVIHITELSKVIEKQKKTSESQSNNVACLEFLTAHFQPTKDTFKVIDTLKAYVSSCLENQDGIASMIELVDTTWAQVAKGNYNSKWPPI